MYLFVKASLSLKSGQARAISCIIHHVSQLDVWSRYEMMLFSMSLNFLKVWRFSSFSSKHAIKKGEQAATRILRKLTYESRDSDSY